MTDIYYVDGAFLPADEAVIPVTDLAILRGYGVFDFMRTYNGKPFHLEAHTERLFRSAQAIGMALPWTQDEINAIVMQTVERNDHPDYNVRIVITGGTGIDSITPADKPRLLVLVTEAHPIPDHYYTDGAKIITIRDNRYLPGVKSINYAAAVQALQFAKSQDAVEALYIQDETKALEGTTTNLFVFDGDTLITPPVDAVLAGITRQVVLDIVEGVFPVEIRDIHRAELHKADEVFITASNKQVMPVVQVDDVTIANGRPGERTRRVMQLFAEVTGVALPQ